MSDNACDHCVCHTATIDQSFEPMQKTLLSAPAYCKTGNAQLLAAKKTLHQLKLYFSWGYLHQQPGDTNSEMALGFNSCNARMINSGSLRKCQYAGALPCANVAGYSRRCHRGRARTVNVCALHIDRRRHLELAWKRQAEREARLAQLDLSQGSNGNVIKVEDLEHLEALLEKSGTCMTILFFYSRTCGVCKDALKQYEAMCKDAAGSRARVVFMQADVINEYDQLSDIAVWHKVRHVPTFLFLDDGAVIRRLSLRDIRQMAGTTDWIQGALASDMHKLQRTFREMLFKRAPSTR